MNFYCTLDDLKSELEITDTSKDATLKRDIEAASRDIDGHCRRHFFMWNGVRYFDSRAADELLIDDLLVLTSLKRDTEQDGVFDDEIWVEDTDFILAPYNEWPKEEVRVTPYGNFAFTALKRSIEITGKWGYGDGESANPVESLGTTVELADASTESGTAGASGIIQVGQTLLLEDEQVFVEAVDGTSLTLKRGTNGTTAVSHDPGVAASVFLYPKDVSHACIQVAKEYYNTRKDAGKQSEKIGNYSWNRFPNQAQRSLEAINLYRKVVAV